MDYQWNWGILLSPVSTGEPTTYLGWLGTGLLTTIQVSAAGWIIAFFVGSVLGILRTLPQKWARQIGASYVAIFRNIPLIVQFFIWYFVIPELLPEAAGNWYKQLEPNTQFFSSAIICLGLFTAARICEQVRSGIEALPVGQKSAGMALGLTTFRVYRYVLLPNAYRIIIPPLTSETMNIVKNSAVASVIGLMELSAQARQLVDYTAQAYESFIVVTITYFFLNFMIMIVMQWIETKLRLPGYVGSK